MRRRVCATGGTGGGSRFNLRREASPRATSLLDQITKANGKFQSQARSQSPCDISLPVFTSMIGCVSISGEKPVPVRHRSTFGQCYLDLVVSISGEKPVPVRQRTSISVSFHKVCFNLRREASPRATLRLVCSAACRSLFQSQARSQSPCDDASCALCAGLSATFQSQARSQSPCDSAKIVHPCLLW